MGLLNRMDAANKRTLDKHNRQERPLMTKGASAVLGFWLGGTVLVMLICIVALIIKG